MDFLQQTNLMKAIFLKNKKNKEKTALPTPSYYVDSINTTFLLDIQTQRLCKNWHSMWASYNDTLTHTLLC